MPKSDSYVFRQMLTATEKEVHLKLNSEIGDWQAFPKVALSSLVDVSAAFDEGASPLVSGHVADFVICDKSLIARAVLELEEPRHDLLEAQRLSEEKDDVLVEAGYSVFRINPRLGPYKGLDEVLLDIEYAKQVPHFKPKRRERIAPRKQNVQAAAFQLSEPTAQEPLRASAAPLSAGIPPAKLSPPLRLPSSSPWLAKYALYSAALLFLVAVGTTAYLYSQFQAVAESPRSLSEPQAPTDVKVVEVATPNTVSLPLANDVTPAAPEPSGETNAPAAQPNRCELVSRLATALEGRPGTELAELVANARCGEVESIGVPEGFLLKASAAVNVLVAERCGELVGYSTDLAQGPYAPDVALEGLLKLMDDAIAKNCF